MIHDEDEEEEDEEVDDEVGTAFLLLLEATREGADFIGVMTEGDVDVDAEDDGADVVYFSPLLLRI